MNEKRNMVYMAHRCLLALVLILTLESIGFANHEGFIANKGQIVNQDGVFNKRVLYLFSGPAYNVSLYADHIAYEIFTVVDKDSVECERMELWFQSSNPEVDISASSPVSTQINYFKNGESFQNIMSHDTIYYGNIWDGINAQFYISDGKFKYDFLVDPDAQNTIEFRIEGAKQEIAYRSILYQMGNHSITEEIPAVYQLRGDRRIEFEDFKLSSKGSFMRYHLPKNRSALVIIDPIAYGLKYSTYYGGSDIDYLNSIDKLSNGDVIIGGYTLSTNNIATTGAYQTTISDFDVFISRFNGAGNRIWGTYLGGSGYDRTYAIAVDADDNIVVSGNTFSTTGIASSGTHQQTLMSTDDAFIVKFDSSGQYLWGTYFGGNAHDFIGDIDVDSIGRVYVTGHTRSTNGITTFDAHNGVLLGLESAFLAVFDSTGMQLHGTYYGSGSLDEGWGILSAQDGSIYMCGYTSSTSMIAFGAAYQPSYTGSIDAFLVKFSASYIPVWGSYIGGSGEDKSFAICQDDSSNVYVVGNTTSNNLISLGNVFQDSMNSTDEAFLMKFDSAGAKKWGTYVGGTGVDYLKGVNFQQDKIWAVGHTTSATMLATDDATFMTNVGMYDNLIMSFNRNGNRLWSTYTGGSQNDFAFDLAVINDRDVVVAGYTESTNANSTSNAHQNSYGGQLYDGFWQRICQPISLTELSLAGTQFICYDDTVILSSMNDFSGYEWNNGDTLDSIRITAPGKYWLATVDSNLCPGRSDTVTFIGVPALSPSVTGGAALVCALDSVVIGIDTILTAYQWNTGDTTNQLTVSNTGIYWALVQDSAGCWYGTDTFTLSFFPGNYLIDTGYSTILCIDGVVPLMADSTLSNVIWNTGDTSLLIFANNAGTYWFTAIDSNGCVILSDTLAIALSGFQSPTVTIATSGSTLLCMNDTVQLETTAQFMHYYWSTGANSSTIEVETPGEFYVLIVDSLGCTAFSDTITTTFAVSSSSVIGIPNGSIMCEGDSLLLQADSNALTIQWSSGDTIGNIYTQNEGDYYYTMVDSQGCTIESDTVYVQFYIGQTPVISPDLPDTSYCEGSSFLLSSVPGGYTSYEWSNGDSNEQAPFIFDSAGTYIVSLQVVDSNNCSRFDTLVLFIDECLGDGLPMKLRPVSLMVSWSNGQLRIISGEAIHTVFVIDQLGRIVRGYNNVNSKELIIPVTYLKPGVYFLRADGNGSIQATKFIVPTSFTPRQ